MCGLWQDQMLDELYGLLEPAESADLAAHIATCPACFEAMVRAKADQTLLAKASKESFPKVMFVKPAEASTVVAERTRTARSVWLNWVVAASVLLVAAGTLIPALWTMGTYVSAQAKLTKGQAEFESTTNETKQIQAQFESVIGTAQAAVVEAKSKHDQLVTEWVSAEKAAGLPFAVTVRGPAAAIPGAPNVYGIAAIDGNDRPVAATIEATLRGSSGTVYFTRQFETANGRGANLTIPASVWPKSKSSETLSLAIKATNTLTKQTSELSEPIAILTASYATVLSTDAPIYRPGDQIAFRSLTLDRTTFQPPERPIALAFCLIDARGVVAKSGNQELMLISSTKLETADGAHYRPLLGPDGKPVQGIGCGELRIPPALAAGSYKLCVYELPIGATKPAPNATPLATRPILIQQFETHRFVKTLTFDKPSYGPGEVVTVTLTVSEQGRPVSNRQLMVSATADGQPIVDLVDSKLVDGKATIRFTLPKTLTQASVSVAVLDGVHETIVRPVPLVTKQVKIDFFPEGGDLVAGVPNRIYIRGIRRGDQPADFEGTIQDGETVIANVKASSDSDQPGANRGIGIASFVPQAGKNYTFRTTRPVAQQFNLPAVKADGVVMAIPTGVVSPGQPIVVNVASTANRKLVIGAYARGTPIAHAAVDVEANKPTTVTLTTYANAPGGVTRVTVFEEPDLTQPGRKDLKPVAERLIFRTHPKKLNLAMTVDSNGLNTTGSSTFNPGQALRVKVTAKNEANQPTAAIVFTSVASETIYSTADDLTDRALPTHFLLGGEIERPDALERADFLLSDHPQAAVALDGLLGTQGWRRFAEQNPANFRKTAKPDDADRLLVAVGSTAPIAADYKPAVERVIRAYQPKYDAAFEALAAAERAREEIRSESPLAVSLIKSSGRSHQIFEQWNSDLSDLRATVHDVDSRPMMVMTMALMIGILIVLIGIRLTFARSWTERGTLTKGIGLIAAMLVIAGLVHGFVSQRVAAMKLTPIHSHINPARPASNHSDIQVAASGFESFGPAAPIRLIAGANASDSPGGRPIVLTQDGIDLGTRSDGPQIPTIEESDSRRSLRRNLLETTESQSVQAAATAHMPSVVREYSTSFLGKRPDVFTEVLYWHPVIVVPGEGESAWLPFTLNEAVASYRVTVAGHSLDGRLGQATTRIRVQKPLEVGAKLPREIGMNDRVDLIATARQNSDHDTMSPRLFVRGVNILVNTNNEIEKQSVVIDETTHMGRRVVRLTPTESTSARLTVSLADSDSLHGDQTTKSISIVPVGEKHEGVINVVVNRKQAFTLAIPKDLKSPAVIVRALADPLAELESSIGALARNPAACFEQSAANIYPNLLMMPWLEGNRQAGVRESLPGSFRKLMAYECDAGPKQKAGFEWFGGSATPNESLTAYGLLLFSEVNRVTPIDADLLNRTKQFLLSRRDGQGGFRLSGTARDQFGRAPQAVANAYIAYALHETDPKLDLQSETAAVVAEALASADPYRLALAAMTASDNAKLLTALTEKQAADGSVPGSQTSITNSGGPDLLTETTALAVLAWQKSGQYSTNVQKAIRFLLTRRQANGGFGGTQATILTLKAFNVARRGMTPVKPTDAFSVSHNGRRIRACALDELFAQEYDIPPLGITIESTVEGDLPFSIAWEGYLDAKTVIHPKLGFDVALAKSELLEGESVSLAVTLANHDTNDSGMIVARVGLPAGLIVPTDGKQLTELTHRSAAGEALPAFWEVKGRELILYYRNLKAEQSTTTRIDLIAEYPGIYEGPMSYAVRSYDSSVESKLLPLKVTIEAIP